MRKIPLSVLGLALLSGCDACDIDLPSRPTQAEYGSIEGVVEVADGAPVADVTVVVTKSYTTCWSCGPGTEGHRTVATVETNGDGVFEIPEIATGRYEIHVEGNDQFYGDGPQDIRVREDETTSTSLALHPWLQRLEVDAEEIVENGTRFVRIHATFSNDAPDSIVIRGNCPNTRWFGARSATLGGIRVQNPREPCSEDELIVPPGGSVESSLDFRLGWTPEGDSYPLPPGEYTIEVSVWLYEEDFVLGRRLTRTIEVRLR